VACETQSASTKREPSQRRCGDMLWNRVGGRGKKKSSNQRQMIDRG
jgi:hypothetical protein